MFADEEEDPLTEEVLQEFINYEKEIRVLESRRVEENLVFHEVQLKNLQDALSVSEANLEVSKTNVSIESCIARINDFTKDGVGGLTFR